MTQGIFFCFEKFKKRLTVAVNAGHSVDQTLWTPGRVTKGWRVVYYH